MSTLSEPNNTGSRTSQTISYDNSFDLLSNHRRRYTLHYLEQKGGEVSIGELSDHIAAWENEITYDEVSYDERKRVYTSLQQVHLPRMDEMDVIDYDDREGTVEVGPAAEELDFYLEIVGKYDIPWSVLYLGLALLNFSALVAVAVGVPGTELIPPLGWALFCITSFSVVSVCHLYINHTEMRLGGDGPPTELQE